MFKRISSLVLVLMVGSSVFAATVRLEAEHICRITGMPMVPHAGHVERMKVSTTKEMSVEEQSDMEDMSSMEGCDREMSAPEPSDTESIPGLDIAGVGAMPYCGKDRIEAANELLSNSGLCCVTIPQGPSASTTPVNGRSSSDRIVITHPTVMQPLLSLPKPTVRHQMTQLYLPSLQATYVRNLAFLI